MKRSGLALLDAVGLVAAARVLLRSRSLILTYHGILPGDDDSYDFLNHNFISEAMFDRQLRYLRQHYRPIALSELAACYARGTQPPSRSVAITFDDGFANNYSVAFPVLRRHGVPFTIFLTTGLVGEPRAQLWTERVKRAIYLHPASSFTLDVLGQHVVCDLTSATRRAAAAQRILRVLKRQPLAARDLALQTIEAACGRPPLRPEEQKRYAFLEWPQVREMAGAGVEFGSHTVQHPILATLDDGSLDNELVKSKQRIETELGKECPAFAYPNGSSADFGDREKRALRRAGYRFACSLNGRLNGDRPDPFEIDRINVGRHLDLRAFQAATTGLLAAARQARQRLTAARGTMATAGERS